MDARRVIGRARRCGLLVAWTGVLVATVALVGPAPRLDRPAGTGGWLDDGGVGATVAVLRLAVLALAWYLLAATVLAVGARLARVPRLLAATDLVTIPAVRRLAEGAVGVSLAAAVLTADVGGLPARPAVAAVAESGPVTDPPVMRRAADGPAVPHMRRLPDAAPAATWTVRPGDHLWRVAEEVLTAAWGRPPTDREITPYWRDVVEANRPRLPDPRNPDLIWPSMELTVPPPPAPPGR